jgi:hypothetical protein
LFLPGTALGAHHNSAALFLKGTVSNKPKRVSGRSLNTDNMTRFRDDLRNFSWDDVLVQNDVDVCYDIFWDKFKLLYDMRFPVVSVKFNKNYHKVSDFMTTGLIVSRRTKISLLKLSITVNTNENVLKYKQYRNLYNKLVRLSKKLFIEDQVKKNKKKT